MLCPRCKCGACYPLHRKGVDWPIFFFGLGLRPARCLTCMRKFYARYTLDAPRPPRRLAADDASERSPLSASGASDKKRPWDRAA